MNVDRMLGVICGMAVGIILVVVLVRFMNKDKAGKPQYDERQQVIRGRGFRFGYLSTMIVIAIMIVLSMGEIKLPMVDAVSYFLILTVGLVAAVSYFIWNEAYWGINTEQPRFYLVMLAEILLNVFPVVNAVKSGELVIDGVLGITGVNLICIILSVVVVAEAFAKSIVDRKAGEE